MKRTTLDLAPGNQPVVLPDGEQSLDWHEPNTGSDVSVSLSMEDIAVEETVIWPVPAYQITDDVKCHGYYCRDCCQCGRYKIVTGEKHAALWARRDMESARCDHFIGIVQSK